jgi:hypothetical protein
MRIAFDRFVALTAALAGAGGTLSACGAEDPVTEPGTGGNVSAGTPGKGGGAGKSVGGARSSGGSAGKSNGNSGSSSSNTGGSANNDGGANDDGGSGGNSAGRGGSSGSSSTGGANPGSGGTGVAGMLGEAGDGGAAGSTGASGEGGAPMSGGAGQGGEGGASSDACLGDTGIANCYGLGLPSDECTYYWNPLMISCYASTGGLRAGALAGLGACLLDITDDACTSEAETATYACEVDVAQRACPASEAVDACANGVELEGGGTVASPLVACDDGTLTQESCSGLLNAVNLAALPTVVACADPAGEYGGVFSGTCAERLHHCVFPHAWFYPW